MIIGFDGGFKDTKIIGNNKIVKFPGYAIPTHESNFSLNGHDRIIIEVDGQQFTCGNEAVRMGSTENLRTSKWISTPEYKALFLAAISELTTASRINVQMVTGLPLADYQADRDALGDILTREHKFKRAGRNTQVVHVQEVRVIPQAWGCLLGELLDDKGRYAHPELAKQRTAIIDCGGLTVNYLAVSGLSDLPQASESTERGAWAVVEAVRDYLKVHHNELYKTTPMHELMTCIIDREIFDAGERVDLEPVVAPILDSIGNEILNQAKRNWGERAVQFRTILVCGGGAYLFGQRIMAGFERSGVVIVQEPEYANARGYYRFGCKVFQNAK